MPHITIVAQASPVRRFGQLAPLVARFARVVPRRTRVGLTRLRLELALNCYCTAHFTLDDHARSSTIRICYNLQTHAYPDQIARLVRTLTRADPSCVVYVSHDRAGASLTAEIVDSPAVHVSLDEGGRGRFHNVVRWLGAARWLQANGSVDYVVTLTAQDYPVRPIAQLHAALTDSGDGLMEFFPVLSSGGNWPIHEGRARYLYSWHDLRSLSGTAKDRLRPLLVANRMQPFVRLNVAYDNLRLGTRAKSPFDDSFTCWGGSFFTNLSWRCVEYILDTVDHEPHVLAWAQRSLLIEEAFFQSILVSADRFRFKNSSGRYYNFDRARHGSPATLTASDVPRALASGAFFARKWDAAAGPAVFDTLDTHIRP